MTATALSIVLTAAVLHSGWNFLLKKSRRKLVFVWCFLLAACLIYFPMFLYYWVNCTISTMGWVFIFATGVLHYLYFWLMSGAYERGELSLVYPVSRGSGPLLVPVFAAIFLGERLSVVGIAGIALIICGIYIIHLPSLCMRSFFDPFLKTGNGASVWALGTGGTIAAYSLVDKTGVTLVPPPVYIYLMLLLSWLLLTPHVLAKNREWIPEEWRLNKVTILLVGVLALLTYMMVLFALRMSEVSYVVACRETSIIFSAVYGIFFLGEARTAGKIIGALFITIGVAAIGFAG